MANGVEILPTNINESYSVVGGKQLYDSNSSIAWQRPDWLAMPAVLSTDNKFVGLLAVTNDDFVALSATGAYTVDWGDGTVENFASNTQANHQYIYSSISSTTLSSFNYKQVLVTVTPQAGQTFSSINLLKFHPQDLNTSNHMTKWLDIVVAGSSLTSVALSADWLEDGITYQNVYLDWLERVRILSSAISTFAPGQFYYLKKLQAASFASSAVTSMDSLFAGCTQLKSVALMNIASVTNLNYMFGECFSLKSVPMFNTSSVTDMGAMFYRCFSLESVPLFNTASVTNMNSMFQDCYSLQSVPLFNTASVTNMGSMFYSCSSLQSVPLFDTSSVTDMGAMFYRCFSLQSVPLFNTASVTNMDQAFFGLSSIISFPAINTSSVTNMNQIFGTTGAATLPTVNASNVATGTFGATGASLTSAVASGLKTSCTLYGSMFSQTALETFFDNLGSAIGTPTVTIGLNFGAPTPISLTGTTTSGSSTVTMASTTGLSTGMEISGTGISVAVPVTFQDTANTVTRTAHGLTNGTLVSFPSAPTVSGITTYNPYYVVNATANTFQVSDTVGGAAKNLTNSTQWTLITQGSSTTDSSTFTTASVTLTAGRLYLFSIENSHGTSASAVSAITSGTAGVPTFTSRGTVQFNGTLNRVTVLSAVPSVNWTGSLTINFGGVTQTGVVFSVVEVQNVDTTTNNGIVQAVTATGNSATASVTLAALGSTINATFGAEAHTGTSSVTISTPIGSYVRLSGGTTSTPLQALTTQYSTAGSTTVSATLTSAPWGIIGIEIKTNTIDQSGTCLYGTTITAINPNVSVTLSTPASASGTVTTSSALLKRSKARLKGFTVSG